LDSPSDETHAEQSTPDAPGRQSAPDVPGIDVVEGELMPRGAAVPARSDRTPGTAHLSLIGPDAASTGRSAAGEQY